jgi:Mrp family chromosome partitioning ATPase
MSKDEAVRHSCSSVTPHGTGKKTGSKMDEVLEREVLSQRLGGIGHKILVLSGKGGVGKSTVATQLAMSLASAKKTVGLLDVDIHGPSVPALLGVSKKSVATCGEYIQPVVCRGLTVMSIGFLLPEDTSPVIWRGPMKMNVIKQFLRDVDWGPLDYLLIDCPPGTGDEPLSVAQLIEDATGAIVVTTPQELSLLDVRKSITFCRQLKLPVLGVVENMSGFVCPHCSRTSDIFRQGGGERMARQMGVPFLARIPIDPELVLAGDEGKALTHEHSDSLTAQVFDQIARAVLAASGGEKPDRDAAVPVVSKR